MFLLQPFDQRKQLRNPLDDAVLFGKWWQWDKKAFNSGYCQLWLPDLCCCLCNLLLNHPGLKHFNEPILIYTSKNKPVCIFGQICTVKFVWDFPTRPIVPATVMKTSALLIMYLEIEG